MWVPVQDIERALDFYQNTLGFGLIKRSGPWAEIDAGGATTYSSTSRRVLRNATRGRHARSCVLV